MKRFIVFAYDANERGSGCRDIFGLATELREAEMLVSVAKDKPAVDQIEIYDIHKESLISEWTKGIDQNWRQFDAE
ncbi:hypothetical protein [Enterobacter dykesii]|uniref:hypothetical protein n=1 Tax=Enterobacter dykesii TaxID=2797506 RepID=UPI0032B4D466